MMDQPGKNSVDALIIGGGLAGIHLALAMDRCAFRPLVIDHPDPHSSSRVAAGIINPITGRRFALTWLYDKLEPVFKEVYPFWENKWGSAFFKPVDIYRSVPENKLVNDLDSKLIEPGYKKYCRKMTSNEVTAVSETIRFRPPGYVMNGYQLETGKFLEKAIGYLSGKGMYLQGCFEVPHTNHSPDDFSFQNVSSSKIIWATGAAIVQHPHFSWVRMNPNKGEILHVDVQGTLPEEIIKQSAFFAPLPDRGVWVGAYNSWDFQNSLPTTKGLEYLKTKARILKPAHSISAHLAAIRPAVEDRRPVIGGHPERPGLYLFNGFGSKGSSLIPYFAREMVDYVFREGNVHPEADVMRYWGGHF